MLVKSCWRAIKTILAFATGAVLASSVATSCFAASGAQPPVSAESARWVVSLGAAEACAGCPSGTAFVLEVRNKLTREVARLRLANPTAHVNEIRIVDPATVAILGTTGPYGGASVVSVARLPDGKSLDTFLCGRPTFSPDNRFLAFVKWAPAHFPPGVWASEEYLAYDLNWNAEQNRVNLKPGVHYDAGWVVYPPSSTNAQLDNIVHGSDAIARSHAMVSPFAWLNGKDILAFVDRHLGVNRLVVADLREGVQRPKETVVALDTSMIVDLPSCKGKVAPSDFERWSKDPGSLILVAHIEALPDDPRVLRLSFSPQPCLATTRLDVRLAEGVGGEEKVSGTFSDTRPFPRCVT